MFTLNRHDGDVEEEIDIVSKNCEDLGVAFAVNEAFLKGGEGAEQLAQTVVDTIERQQPLPIRFTYKEADQLEDKLEKVCKGMGQRFSVPVWLAMASIGDEMMMQPASLSFSVMACLSLNVAVAQ